MRTSLAIFLFTATPCLAQQAQDPALGACQQILGGQFVQTALRESALAKQLEDVKAELAKLKADKPNG